MNDDKVLMLTGRLNDRLQKENEELRRENEELRCDPTYLTVVDLTKQICDANKEIEQLKQQIARITMSMHDVPEKDLLGLIKLKKDYESTREMLIDEWRKRDELWDRVENAAPGEWVKINPDSDVSGFIRYADKIPNTTEPDMITEYRIEQLDKYAVPAIQGITSRINSTCSIKGMVDEAYLIAQAMIKERDRILSVPDLPEVTQPITQNRS